MAKGGGEGEDWTSVTKPAAWIPAPSRSSRDLTWKACIQIADTAAMGDGCARARSVGPAFWFWGAHCEQRASLSRDIYALALARGGVSLARLFGMLFTTCQIIHKNLPYGDHFRGRLLVQPGFITFILLPVRFTLTTLTRNIKIHTRPP